MTIIKISFVIAILCLSLSNPRPMGDVSKLNSLSNAEDSALANNEDSGPKESSVSENPLERSNGDSKNEPAKAEDPLLPNHEDLESKDSKSKFPKKFNAERDSISAVKDKLNGLEKNPNDEGKVEDPENGIQDSLFSGPLYRQDMLKPDVQTNFSSMPRYVVYSRYPDVLHTPDDAEDKLAKDSYAKTLKYIQELLKETSRGKETKIQTEELPAVSSQEDPHPIYTLRSEMDSFGRIRKEGQLLSSFVN